MKKVLIIVGAVVVLAVVAVGFLMMRGPDLSMYERFREPALLALGPQKVLVVEAKGDPNAAGEKAFGFLFSAYFKIDGAKKGPGMPAPRARWPRGVDTPREDWVGLYAMPLPETVAALPALEPPAGLNVTLETWEYGEVAQILHVGPYSTEKPTIERLHGFIKAQDREMAGAHEEEYLRGPGMFGKGDPERYYTLIRYPVRKR